ncbi:MULTISPECIES: 6-phospho-alpha-glucosidase [Enterococcus]|uniref:family 4 glycosyl hydrolase n=1 Tax=Enterococcus TaxID=1350 RepID=UPI000EC95056|nr:MULTISPECIES: 6-phospho-alpha-glucosidase [Enterococcus]HCM87287.1 6-phospho-alpha-glucosidase [Enterococcus sp.]
MKKFNVVFVGGGSTYTPDMMELMCLVKETFPVKKIVLYDNDEERQEPIGQYGEVLFREYYPELEEYVYTTDKATAFKDMDFAFVQIRAGGLPMREQDEKIPLKYGVIGQETCGPGGFAYGIRSVLAMKDLIEDIRRYSPDTWILNYSNPAAIVAEACKLLFPDDHRIINICDMPIDIMDVFCPLADKKRQDVEPRYFGLNHFGWFTALYDKETGEDVLPTILQELLSGNASDKLGFTAKNDDYWNFTFNHLEKMVKDYPYSLPNTYMQYYLYPQEMVEHSDPNYTRANYVMDNREKNVFDYCREIVKLGKMKGTKHDLDLRYGENADNETEKASVANNDAHATYIIELAESLAYNKHDIFLLMVKNDGVIPNVEEGMMLEVACRVGSYGAQPLAYGPIGTFEKGLLESQYAYEKLTVEATLEGSYQKCLQALAVNRTVVDTDLAKTILDEYIEANGQYFPTFS